MMFALALALQSLAWVLYFLALLTSVWVLLLNTVHRVFSWSLSSIVIFHYLVPVRIFARKFVVFHFYYTVEEDASAD